MMKWLLIKLLPAFAGQVTDLLIDGADKLAKQTDNTVDDRLVQRLRDNRDAFVNIIKTTAGRLFKG